MTDTLPPVRGLSLGSKIVIQTPMVDKTKKLENLSLTANEFYIGAPQGALIGTILGATAGSTVMLQSSIVGAVELVSGAILVGPTPPSTSGAFNIMLVEILDGAKNSPNITTIQIVALDIAPTILVPPSIPGTPFVGTPITAIDAIWSGNVRSRTYQWQALGINATGNGAATLTYTPVTADVGKTLTITVTASNIGGTSAPSTSAPSAPVMAPSSDVIKISMQISIGSSEVWI